jgi:YVTN family beta-propeller protein
MVLDYIYVCSTSSDIVSKINLDHFCEEKRIYLKSNDIVYNVGPHGIYTSGNKLITANKYNNTISIVDMKKEIQEESYYIGACCSDVVVYGNNAYIICSDLNSLLVFELKERQVVEEIPCGSLPYSICLNKERKLLLISNMQDDSITLIDCINRKYIKNIRVGSYPTKAVFTLDGQHVLICESNIGSEFRGSIAILSLKNYKIINRISVGNSPMDIYCSSRHCFVSNFGDGTISVLDINNYKEEKKLIVGGMPKNIIKYKENLYVGDNYNDMLIKVNVKNKDKKYIPIGGEPTGMILS